MMSGKPGRLNDVSVNRRSAFTIVEVLVAIFMLAVGIVSLMGALGGLTKAESVVAERDLISRVANEKMQELIATQAWQSEAGGTFDDETLSDYTWSVEEVNVGIDTLTGLNLTVSSTGKGDLTISTVVFTPPAATGGEQGGT